MNNANNPLVQELQQDMTMGKQATIDPYLAGNYSGAISQMPSIIQALQKVNEAQAAEQSLGQNFNQAGGAQGPIGGILSRLGATFTGGEAGSYGNQAQQASQVISNALGVPASDISTPSITQNQTAAQASLGNIQSLIQALLNPTGSQQGATGTTQ